ncbi:MAG: outer membrane protein assembly factor BamD [Bacteroidetes bacterium]|nr:MAG: outer membrane protein assembly factor BamD [Bacteroidota bacterium]
MRGRIFAWGLGLLVIASACSEYNQVMKSADYDRKFALANDLFEREKWLPSIALYEQVYQHAPKSGMGELAYFRLGKSYFAEEDYYMAAYYFGSFFERFPRSNKVEEAYFYRSLSSVNVSPGYSLDQQETQIALNELQQFIYLFPNSERIDTCNQLMDKLRWKLERKEFESVKLYSKTTRYRAAVVSAKKFIQEHPGSPFKEEVMYLQFKNAYLLAENSIEKKKKERIEETIETYRTFVSQFPESKHLREMTGMQDRMQDQLKSLSSAK